MASGSVGIWPGSGEYRRGPHRIACWGMPTLSQLDSVGMAATKAWYGFDFYMNLAQKHTQEMERERK